MEELTLEKKIEFCKKYLAFGGFEYICIYFEEIFFTYPNGMLELEMKALFPELHELIMRVGKELRKGMKYQWGRAWWAGALFDKAFRDEKIQELLDSLQKNNA